MHDELDEEKTRVLTANTAQGVYKHLRENDSNRERVLPRWIWELLQNAHDVANGPGSINTTVKFTGEGLTICHDGRAFELSEITHLIYYGSTKVEQREMYGQFGSGFLTTHLLSPTINVLGHLKDGRVFDFTLDRSGATVADLQHHMDKSWVAFKASLSSRRDCTDEPTLTKFQYPIDKRAMDAVTEGIDVLTRHGSYVMAFNPEFRSIRIESPDGNKVLELTNREDVADQIANVEITVSEQHADEPTTRSYLVSESDEVTVAVPVVDDGKNVRLEGVGNTPRLFVGFPLIGTEDFSFPVVVHSSRFAPTENRDGVFLGRSDNEANLKNKAVLQEACRLILMILDFAGKSGWANTSVLAHVPRIREYPWLNEDWLRNQLRTYLVDPIRGISAVVTDAGPSIIPAKAKFPIADTPCGVDQLWGLAADITEFADKLPRRSEGLNWHKTIMSWADICQHTPNDFDETIDGRSLALLVQSSETLEAIQERLVGEGKAADWLNRLHRFLQKNNSGEVLRTCCIVPDQNGRLRKLSDLHRDQKIPDRLKDIAKSVDWDLRSKLRDSRFSVFADEAGAGDLDRDEILRRLIHCLSDRMDAELDDMSKRVSVRLFGWIVENEQWQFLRGFPAFSDSDEGQQNVLIELARHGEDDEERPLAPILAWPSDLRTYADLFPRRHILAKEFFDEVRDETSWSVLENRTFLRRTVLYSHRKALSDFLPEEPMPDDGKEHTAHDPVEVTEVAFLTKTDVGVMSRVRQSRRRARLFWSFLTQWLVVNDKHAFQTKETQCVCESGHRYFPAAWLVPIKRNQWVPLEGRRTDRATPHALANLIRGSDWPTDLLGKSRQVTELLSVLHVSAPELIMALAAKDEEERSDLDQTVTKLFTAVQHDWSRLGDLADDIQDDEQLFDHLEERREQRRIVRENQRLGTLVEKLVKQSLEGEGFSVQRTGTGSDFAITLTHPDRGTWLVEVKSTRDDTVRMTAVQAREAVRRSQEFLLCVVPLGPGPSDPDIEQVRGCVRFVDGIGSRLRRICAGLDNLEEIRASVTSEDTDGLRLEIESGSPRVRVDSAVWRVGFALEDLLSHLTTD